MRALVRNVRKAKSMHETWKPTTTGSVECIEEDLFAGSLGERTKLFAKCLAGTNAAIHITEAKTKEKDYDAKNIKTFGLLLEPAAGTSSVKRFVFIGSLKNPTIREGIPV